MGVNIEIHLIFKRLKNKTVNEIVHLIEDNLKPYGEVYMGEELAKDKDLTYLVIELPDTFFLETCDKNVENDHKLVRILGGIMEFPIILGIGATNWSEYSSSDYIRWAKTGKLEDIPSNLIILGERFGNKLKNIRNIVEKQPVFLFKERANKMLIYIAPFYLDPKKRAEFPDVSTIKRIKEELKSIVNT